MAYKTIILFLLSTIFQNICLSKGDSLILLGDFEKKIDDIVNIAIKKEAFPGCIVFASYRGNPIYLKSYGFHTYDSLRSVSHTDLFDLASVTKVMAATLALMKLYDDGLIHLDDPLKDYVDGLWLRKLGRVTIRECLAHQAGLKSWIKYYDEIQRKSGKYKNKTISEVRTEDYPFQISEDQFLHKDFYKKIKKMIKKADINEDQGYVYSGLFFYLVPEIVKNITGQSFEAYLDEKLYKPLGAKTLTFNPGEIYDKDQIVPTEIDSFFRFEPIHGKVHDEGAVLMKGVSGNAGLFGNVGDVAKVWHMLMNGGIYNDSTYLHPQTINLFTTCQYPNNENRRGLGFDKPLLQYDSLMSSVAKSVSFNSYGHSGYTGTLVWADPDADLLFVFLSNRVYPTRDHRAIYQLNIRPRIHQVLYDYIEELEKFKLIRTLLNHGCCF